MNKKDTLSTNDIAKILGISRIAVFKRIKAGVIPAKKIGRRFGVDKEDIPEILGKTLSAANKQSVEASVKRTIQEYGTTLQLLGKE